ncbi:MAG: sulfatase [Planctomycetales bacterium]|nr:sulfatase [Planctomycetales bacterium]
MRCALHPISPSFPVLNAVFGLLLLATHCRPAVAETAATDSKPNILFIYLDDFGWRDAGYMGSDFYETPHLDRLAGEGMVFTNAYSCAANCAPARACLLSGQYTPRHRIFNVGTGPRGNAAHRRLQHIPGVSVLDPKLRTWARQLQERGYATGTIGKWHLSDDPCDYGFDVNIGGNHSGSPPRSYYPPHKVVGLEDAPPGEYLTDRLSDESIRFIREHKDRPWALYLTHFAVHTPLDAKRELVAKFERKAPGKLHQHVAMATMIQAVDDGVGKIVAALEELRLDSKTIVIFSSDNGGYGPATDMAPLKGYKGTYYEGGIRVPMFVKWPGVTRAGAKSAEPVIQVDLFPTICELAGAELPKQPLDGLSLAPLLRGERETLGGRPLYWHFPAYLQSYGGPHIDEQRDPLFRSRPCSVIRLGDWKLHQYFEDGAVELYNLGEDVGESQNVAATQPAQAAKLLKQLEQWRADIGAPVPDQANDAFNADAEKQAIERARRVAQQSRSAGQSKSGKSGKGRRKRGAK